MIIQLVFRVTILFLYPIIIIIIINFPRENISFYNFFRAEKFNKVLLIIIIGEMKRWKVYQVLSIGFRSRKKFRKNYSLESTRVLPSLFVFFRGNRSGSCTIGGAFGNRWYLFIRNNETFWLGLIRFLFSTSAFLSNFFEVGTQFPVLTPQRGNFRP